MTLMLLAGRSRTSSLFAGSAACWTKPSRTGHSSRGRVDHLAWYPACDVFEDKEAVKIVAELPGVEPEDVKLSLENNLLTIRGEKKQEAEERSERVHRYERSYGALRAGLRAPQHGGR